MEKWSWLPHQKEGGDWALETMRKYGMAYIIWKERTRKTGAALWATEHSKAEGILIITKFRALDGWREHLEKHELIKEYHLVNYESAHKINCNYQLVILDEAHHAISGFPKKSNTFKTIKKLVGNRAVLYMSATPYAEHRGLLYHQFAVSNYSPFRRFRNAYEFFRVYGIPHMVRTPNGLIERYKKFKDDAIIHDCLHLFNFMDWKDVGISVEPVIRPVVVKPNTETLRLVNTWVKDRVLSIGDDVVGDSIMKMRVVHQQIEGGTIKLSDGHYRIHKIPEKVQYILDNYDLGKIVIMANFVAERMMLEKLLPGVRILSADGHAEGVDLSGEDKLIIYSMSHKTSKHSQRIARQVNHDRKDPIIVDILVMASPLIGMDIYQSVQEKKENFDKYSYLRSIGGDA